VIVIVAKRARRPLQEQNGFLEFLLIDFAAGEQEFCGECWNYKALDASAEKKTTTNFSRVA